MTGKGVSLGGYHCERDLKLILVDADIEMPEVRTSFVDVPGKDGLLDITETIDGTVRYKNRRLKLKFATIERISGQAWHELLSHVGGLIHGKRIKIEFDGEAYYYLGRCTIDEFTVSGKRQELVVICNCDPYKLEKMKRRYSAKLNTGCEGEVDVTGMNVSAQEWNVDLRWGTPEVRTFDWSPYIQLTINLKTAANAATTTNIQFVDTDGKVYSITVDKTSKKSERKTVTVAISGSGAPTGITWSKLYRILLGNAEEATVVGTVGEAVFLRVQGTRMPAVPRIDTDLDVTLKVNGSVYELTAGSWQDPNLVIGEGETVFLFTAKEKTENAEVSVSFQGGKL